MLYQELKKIAPDLAAFMLKIAPDLSSESIDVVKATAIPKGITGRGGAYLFSYRNPVDKGKPNLPYYHSFPFSIVLDRYPNYIQALNLFYLGPTMRGELLENIINSVEGDPENPDSVARISYNILNRYRSALYPAFPCIKNYRIERISPIMIKIKPSLWKEIYLGETAKEHQSFFLGRNPRSVWAQSRIIALESRKVRK